MKTGLLVSLLLLIPLDGTLLRPVPSPRTKPLEKSGGQFVRWQGPRVRVRQEFNAGNFVAAAALARQGYQDASQAGEPQVAARFLNNLGACRFALHQYQDALQTFLKARRLAEAAGDQATAGALDFNISSLYSQLGQIDAAVEAENRAMARLSGEERVRQLPKLLIHEAALRAAQNRMPEALALYQQGIAAAGRAGDQEMCAFGWNDLGFVRLKRKELPQAEQALLEAYRTRKLNHFRGLDNSYCNLGMLRLEQGDLSSAAVLLQAAVAGSKQPGGVAPDWLLYFSRGRLRLAQKRLEDALADLRIAARLARDWRRAAPPDDATRISAENSIQEVHAALVQAGNELYFQTRRPALAEETFEAAEANRAASLRVLAADPRDWRRSLPPEYWETLQKLEAAELALLRSQTPSFEPSPTGRISMLRAALIEWESRAGSHEGVEMPDLLARTRRHLGPDAALFSFHLASPDSYLWAVSSDRLALYRLPPAAEIAGLADRFRKAVREESGDAQALGYRLFGMLFGQIDAAFQTKPRWLLTLDSRLFELPFAALPLEAAPHAPVFLVSRHSLETIPGAEMLASAPPREHSAGPFVGVADAVYNRADPRWTSGAKPSAGSGFTSFWNFFAARAASTASGDLHLPRLAGSALEVKSCAAAWGGPQTPVLLEGVAASRRRLQAALNSHPAVLHLATHVLHSSHDNHSGLIVLSLTGAGQQELLSPAEIAAWNLDGALVSLSGCGSGSADALPATGLMGLTRAWLGAGAQAVVATRWPGPDDAGALFQSFYRYLREAPQAGPATALQRAQMDMLRSQTWRSSPRYWAAYFLTGNQ